jgi:hypothetical protein
MDGTLLAAQVQTALIVPRYVVSREVQPCFHVSPDPTETFSRGRIGGKFSVRSQ